MTTRQTGWVFVLAQGVFLVALMVLPDGTHWSLPTPLRVLASLFFWGGLLLVGLAALRLGAALTPTPVPTLSGQLKTSGLYSWVRHPIYTGVLSVVVGLVIRSQSLLSLSVGLMTIAFFYVKSSWEERQLRRRYPDYEAYARKTPRFIPTLRSDTSLKNDLTEE